MKKAVYFGAAALLMMSVTEALAVPAQWVSVYDEKGKLIGYVDPTAPDYDRSQFCDIANMLCHPDLDGPDGDDDGDK